MIWLLLFVGVLLFAYWLFAPRRLQTLENTPAVVDEKFKAHHLIETTEDPREVRPLAAKAAERVSDIPVPGHGDSLTFDWPNDRQEPHGEGQRSQGGPPNQP